MKQKIFVAWRYLQKFCLSWQGQVITLLLLLTKILWGVWAWRDQTSGDTSSYFSQIAQHLNAGGLLSLVFSPLYLKYYSFFIYWFEDAFVATLLHRVVLLIMLAVSVLLLSRALLPRAIAWLVAAWWVVLPINWNALYEVHLFGFLPLVLGSWMLAGRRRRFSLSVGLALVWTSALLVRNEFALSVALLATCLVAREWWLWRKAGGSFAGMSRKIALLALPSLVVLGLSCVAFRNDWPGWKGLQGWFMARTTLNMAQVYPFSYQQRHPEWKDDPWLQGGPLVKKQFGKAHITFSDAFRRNRSAMMEHVLWHLQLLPAGLQLGMFNGHFGALTPDFTPPRQLPVRAAVLSSLVLLVMAAGAFCMWKRRAFFKRFFCSRRGWAWLGLLCLLPPCAVAIATQRPRPSYIFPLTFFLMALTGLCLYAVLHRLNLWRGFQKVFPLIVAAVLLSAFSVESTAQLYTGQPMKEIYERVFQFREHLRGARAVYASREFTWEVYGYINLTNRRKQHFYTLTWDSERTAAGFEATLNEKRVSLLYLGAYDFAEPAVQEWLRNDGAKHWNQLAADLQIEKPWALLERKDEKPASKPEDAEPKPDSPDNP